MTNKDRLHTNRVLRVLNDAVKKLEKLSDAARVNDSFPKTTQKAFIEQMTLLNNTKIRVIAGNVSAV